MIRSTKKSAILSFSLACFIFAPGIAQAWTELQCPSYELGQSQRSCLLTAISDCSAAFPSCDSQVFNLTTSDVSARVQDLCCPQPTLEGRNDCFKNQRRRIMRARGLKYLYRKSLRNIITGYLSSDTVCGEE